MTYNKNKLSIQNFDYNPTLMNDEEVYNLIHNCYYRLIHSFISLLHKLFIGPKNVLYRAPGSYYKLIAMKWRF